MPSCEHVVVMKLDRFAVVALCSNTYARAYLHAVTNCSTGAWPDHPQIQARSARQDEPIALYEKQNEKSQELWVSGVFSGLVDS